MKAQTMHVDRLHDSHIMSLPVTLYHKQTAGQGSRLGRHISALQVIVAFT